MNLLSDARAGEIDGDLFDLLQRAVGLHREVGDVACSRNVIVRQVLRAQSVECVEPRQVRSAWSRAEARRIQHAGERCVCIRDRQRQCGLPRGEKLCS